MINESPVRLQALEKFHLSFEYDKTWHEAKKSVKARTDNTQ
jgi:hypothetical protein